MSPLPDSKSQYGSTFDVEIEGPHAQICQFLSLKSNMKIDLTERV